MKLYAHKRKDGYFDHFYVSPKVVKYCGVPENEIIGVEVEIDENGDYYGYLDLKDNDLDFIYKKEFLVRMCSPDGFKYCEENGFGKVVRVSVKEIING